MKTKYLISVGILCTSLGFSSCSDYLDMTPTNEVSDKTVWNSVTNAELAVNSFYHYTAYFGNYNEGQCKAGMTEGLTDLIKYGDANYNAYRYVPNELSYGETSVVDANYVATYLGNWAKVYEYVRRVNEALYNLDKYGNFAPDDVTRLEAELRFFRGMLYFDLVKRYKEVIIYDKDLTKIQPNMPLSTEEQGWDFVESDLNFAGEHLKKSATSNGRVTSGAAYALLSRAMLYAERWAKAKAAAEEVINSKLYSLVKDNYVDAFKSNSRNLTATIRLEVWQIRLRKWLNLMNMLLREVSPIGLHGIQQKVRKKILHTANWNHAFKLLYSIMEPHGKVVR